MIPEELARLLTEASTSLEVDSRGHLSRAVRVRILRCFGPESPDYGIAPLGDGLVRRASLAINCVRRALPLWDEIRPIDDCPRLLLALAEQVLARTVEIEHAVQQRRQFRAYTEDLGGEYPDDMRIAVGHAAVLALRTALLDELALDDDRDDDDIDIECDDAAYVVSSIYAGAWLEEPNSDNAARRSFWEWYLRDGIPSLYR